MSVMVATSRASLIEHLAMIAGGPQWRCVSVAAFTVYFDASGTEHDQPCLAVAGYLAPAAAWVEFEEPWVRRLKRDGLKYFHAAEIERQITDRGRLRALYEDLIEIIRGHASRQFGCCIVNSSLLEFSQAEREEWNLTAYSVAGQACVHQVRAWCRRERFPSLPEFIFECGDTGKGTLIAVLDEDGGFPTPTFKPKKDTMKGGFLIKGAVPLQAADMLAFELFDPVRKIELDGHLLRIRPSYEALYKIPGTPKGIALKTMQDLRRFGTMKDDEIWLPDSPDDIHIPLQ
jgi:hypothetical protein